jgi:hypothetical protein
LRADKVNAGEYYKKMIEADPAHPKAEKAASVLKQLKIKY